MATVGIVVRTKDRPQFLTRALRSITAQSYADWQAIIVNDGGDPATVREVVEYGRHPHRSRWGGGDPAGTALVDRVMDMTGVGELAGRSVETLSGGQAQRVWLASCLAQDTPVLLLDEAEVRSMVADVQTAYAGTDAAAVTVDDDHIRHACLDLLPALDFEEELRGLEFSAALSAIRIARSASA